MQLKRIPCLPIVVGKKKQYMSRVKKKHFDQHLSFFVEIQIFRKHNWIRNKSSLFY